MCVWKGRDTKFQFLLLFFEDILLLTRRWREGDTKAIKATVLKIFLFFILIWRPALWSSVQKPIGCLMINVLLCQCLLKQSRGFYSVPEIEYFFLPFPFWPHISPTSKKSVVSVFIASLCSQINTIFQEASNRRAEQWWCRWLVVSLAILSRHIQTEGAGDSISRC